MKFGHRAPVRSIRRRPIDLLAHWITTDPYRKAASLKLDHVRSRIDTEGKFREERMMGKNDDLSPLRQKVQRSKDSFAPAGVGANPEIVADERQRLHAVNGVLDGCYAKTEIELVTRAVT
jgi:hypothetical protein